MLTHTSSLAALVKSVKAKTQQAQAGAKRRKF